MNISERDKMFIFIYKHIYIYEIEIDTKSYG